MKCIASRFESYRGRGGSDDGALVVDLLLESAFLASNAAVLLERVWPVLASDGGKLLRRMLRRFLFSSTVSADEIESLVATLRK
jgi:hypothetical protein